MQWNDAKPCGCALVASGSTLLLIRRAHEPWKDMWDVPGGFCEPNEHPMDTAAREVLEETGLTVRVTGFLGIWLDAYDEPGTIGKRTMNVFYHAVPLTPDARVSPSSEATEAAFFPMWELPEAIAFPGHLPSAIGAWRRATEAGTLVTALLDRPGSAAR
jgi:ADP-ribose pyrophosphatase YjhB (NUDIX family)